MTATEPDALATALADFEARVMARLDALRRLAEATERRPQ